MCSRTGLQYAIKIFACPRSFEAEKEFYLQETGRANACCSRDPHLVQCLKVLDMSRYELADSRPVSLPPCIVMERGDSLEAAMRRAWPDRMTALAVCSAQGLLPCLYSALSILNYSFRPLVSEHMHSAPH